jgi:acetoin utilization protein AcuC
MTKSAFIYDEALAEHKLSDTHPLKPVRLRYTYELLESYGAFQAPGSALVSPRPATEDEVLSFHTPDYVSAIKLLSRGGTTPAPSVFNLGTSDNPAYEGMFEAAMLSTGASLKAAELVASGEADAAFNISGGLHHAMPGYASGFCVFNDPVIAIKALVERGMRVAYVDIDCHHGDGVQHAFYETDEVLTISIHETGSHIFPGTGSVEELGTGRGRGYSVNLPLYPYTGDTEYLWAFREVVPPLLEYLQPDVLVTQLGIDSHFRDPITHLALTVQGFGAAVAEFPRFSQKWVALGGGGYDVQAVARAWTLAFGIMSGQEFADEVPASYRYRYGVSTLADREDPPVTDQMRKDARAFAERSVDQVRRLVFAVHGLRPA